MKGSEKVIQLLNKALAVELAAVNQYFLHSRMYKSWGLGALAKHEYEESLEEMHHADALIERILFLEGLPNMQTPAKLAIGKTLPECIEGDLKLELGGHRLYVEAIAFSESVKDYVSREILDKILKDTEGHIDYLETQRGLIEKLGLQNYLQSATGSLAS